MYEFTFYLKAFIFILVLVNPLEGIPIFLAGTEGVAPELKKAIVRRAPLAITIILLLSLFLGKALLQLFGITIGAFQMGGGIILFLIAVQMLLGSGGDAFKKMSGGSITKNFAVVPLAIPIMAGPGAINGAVLYGTRAHSLWEMVLLAGVILVVGAAAYVSLLAAGPLARFLKDTGISIASRIMGLIIAAIAVEMVAHGVGNLFGLKVFVN